MAQKGRTPFLLQIIREFEKFEHERAGILEGVAYTPHPFPAEALMSLRAQLGQRFHKNILLTQEIDKNLLGGLKIQVGSYVFDGSVANQLKRMKHALKEGYNATARQ